MASTVSANIGWASDFTQAVTVKLTLHQLCTGTVTGLASPSDLAAAIVSQHADSSSRLWRGYLTKTLDKDVAPVTAEVDLQRLVQTRTERSFFEKTSQNFQKVFRFLSEIFGFRGKGSARVSLEYFRILQM